MTASVDLVWATDDMMARVAYMARVSNPENQDNPSYEKLINYLIRNQHWSPFEMGNVCIEIVTTRDIARQILRHRSFTFQEFSQRYAEVSDDWIICSEARLQDTKNRQNSLETEDNELATWWFVAQFEAAQKAYKTYDEALAKGIAKEVARKVLPEGLMMSRMYVNGTLRSWMHYIKLRTDKSTQKEHREVAEKCKTVILSLCPNLKEYFDDNQD